MALLPPGCLRTQGAAIVAAGGRSVTLAGVNWYGFDCNSMVAGGLDRLPLGEICDTIAALGFNTVRLPFCLELVQDNPRITRFLDANPELRGWPALEIMDRVIAALGDTGLKVILDSHRSEAGWSLQGNGLWYTRQYPASAWLQVWQDLAARYRDLPSADNPTVVGCDLRNEPGDPPHDPDAWPGIGGALWGYGDGRYPRNWPAAAEQAGNAILAVNPQLLIFVEGVRYDPAGPASNHNLYWFGGNLTGVANSPPFPERPAPVPVRLDIPNRLVYSVHDYGPDMVGGSLPWSTQAECNAVWDQTWGYLVKRDLAPVWLGEFGTSNGHQPGDRTLPSDYTDPNPRRPQGAWFTHLVAYLADLQESHGSGHWCYWALNGSQSAAPGRDPALPDWYGVLTPDWRDVASIPLMDRLQSIQ